MRIQTQVVQTAWVFAFLCRPNVSRWPHHRAQQNPPCQEALDSTHWFLGSAFARTAPQFDRINSKAAGLSVARTARDIAARPASSRRAFESSVGQSLPCLTFEPIRQLLAGPAILCLQLVAERETGPLVETRIGPREFVSRAAGLNPFAVRLLL